jgi:phage portal protein BeeE
MTIPAEQAQLVDQLKWTVEDVARVYGMPLYKINAGTIPAGTPIEALNQQYYDDCLQPHIEAFELALDEGLAVPSGMGVEMDITGLLRMDQGKAMSMLGDGVKNTILKPNDARRRLNLPPVEGGETLYMQQQNYSLAALAKRDAGADPFGKAASATPSLPTPPAPPASTPAPAKDLDEVETAALIDSFTKGLEHV